jgi:hypothetical protein
MDRAVLEMIIGTEYVTARDIEDYREEVGILSEDLVRTDVNPYFEEDE